MPAPAPALVAAALTRARSPFREPPARWLLVDVAAQRLHLLHGATSVADYAVSTAANGVGGESGSFQTPPGWHRIHRRIGGGAPRGTVFVSREPTGEVWTTDELRDDDLIVTRILTLEGLEEGINRGPGCDSLERYIYVHGTNHEAAIGRPVSHGCVRMANAAIEALFDRVEQGDPLVIVAPGPGAMPDPRSAARFHYAGVGGSGMSALAQFQAMRGGRASGSDRGFDRGERPEARAQLERLGVGIFPQDGTGADGDCAAVVVSTAVEEQVPDFAVAKRRGLPLVHRSEMLAHWVAESRSVAVSGTSGKSTVVAMTFEALRGAGEDPSVITGGELALLQAEGLWGNAWAGAGALVVEADESDGSLVRYQPAIGLATNLTRDHKTEAEVATMFATLKSRTRERFVCGEGGALGALRDGALVFGFGERADVRGTEVELGPQGSAFTACGARFALPVPGRHNVENALAAIAVCRALGVDASRLVGPLAAFRGVARRFQSLGVARGVEVVDDFAHNPAKIAAALATARLRGARVLAVYQPHGYGPTRFLREDFVETLVTELRPDDRAWLLEVFYAGGTALRDFSSADLARDMAARGARVEFAPSREWLVGRIASEARDGDLVLVMGARDPSLTTFAKDVLAALAR